MSFLGALLRLRASTATATYDATAATPAADYSLTLTDIDGTSNTLTDAFTVTAAPTIYVGIAPTPIYEGTGANTVTISGAGFETGATVTFTAIGRFIGPWYGSYGLGDLGERRAEARSF